MKDMSAVIAKAPAGRAATAYVECVRSRDPEGLARLFAAGGVLTLPDGRSLAGSEAVRGFYRDLFDGDPPTPRITSLTEDGRRAVAELEAWRPGRVTRAIDVFEVDDDGLLTAVRVYRQGP